MAPPPPQQQHHQQQQNERLLAASGGDGVKLFDAAASMENRPDPCVSHFVPSPGVQINMVRWNHTNHVLASSGEDRKISLWLKGGKLLGSVPRPDADTGDLMDEAILAINFSTKSSRYLCSGGTGKVVRIWDMQRKRCIKWLKGHTDTITGVMYNCKDEHLASINTRGDLIVYSLASGSRVTETKDPHNQVLRVLEYSRLSRHLLLTAGDDGSVHLWDTTGRQPKVSWFKQHLAPTTGACFSPCNEKIVVSVGLDKRLYTFDVGSRKPTGSISGDAPFSSLTFQDDGWTLAAGTNNGRVLFYDLRNKIQPMAMLRAFNPSEAVASLSWQHSSPVPINTSNWSPDVALLGSAGNDSVMLPDPLPATSGSRKGHSSKRPSSLSVSNMNKDEETPTHARWSSSGSFILHPAKNYPSAVDDMEVFSPLVDVQPIVPPASSYMDGSKRPSPSGKRRTSDDKKSQDRKHSHSHSQNDQWSPAPALSTPDVCSKPDKSPSVTPPEAWGGETERGASRGQSATSRFASAGGTAVTSSRGELFGRVMSGPEAEQPLQYSKSEFLRNASELSVKLSGFPPPGGPNSPTSALLKGPSVSGVDKKDQDEDLPALENGVTSKRRSFSPGVNASPQAAPRASGNSASGNSNSGNSSSFALQLVQRALEESLVSVQKSIHEDVQNLHVELLRQFHIQHTDMSVMVEKLAAQQAELMEEVHALRKENQQLRHLL